MIKIKSAKNGAINIYGENGEKINTNFEVLSAKEEMGGQIFRVSAMIGKNSCMGVIDSTGKIVIPIGKYRHIYDFNESGVALCKAICHGGTTFGGTGIGLVNTKGEEILVPAIGRNIERFFVKSDKDNKWKNVGFLVDDAFEYEYAQKSTILDSEGNQLMPQDHSRSSLIKLIDFADDYLMRSKDEFRFDVECTREYLNFLSYYYDFLLKNSSSSTVKNLCKKAFEKKSQAVIGRFNKFAERLGIEEMKATDIVDAKYENLVLSMQGDEDEKC